jgi:hypothetical protein
LKGSNKSPKLSMSKIERGSLENSNSFVYHSLAFLLDPLFKTEIFSKMTEEEKDEFWRKWALVYMGDDELVTELVGQKERKL